MGTQKVIRNSAHAGRLPLTMMVFLATSSCAQSDDGHNAKENEESRRTSEASAVSKELEKTSDSPTPDAEALLERTYKSPMTELDSVEDVLLSDEEQQRLEKAQAEAEHETKRPSCPDD